MVALLNIMALDVGEVRVGVATANSQTRLATPLLTLKRSNTFFKELINLVKETDTNILVIGLPYRMDGGETLQTGKTRDFAKVLKTYIDLPLYFEDETLSSVRAEEFLGADNKPYAKEKVDALAASYILEDFIVNNPEIIND
jgi:putative Holliday junction resolvase